MVAQRSRAGGLQHEIVMNNNLSDKRPSCIRFWETESDSLVLFGFEMGLFFPPTKIVRF